MAARLPEVQSIKSPCQGFLNQIIAAAAVPRQGTGIAPEMRDLPGNEVMILLHDAVRY
jgi:hypothetical protein